MTQFYRQIENFPDPILNPSPQTRLPRPKSKYMFHAVGQRFLRWAKSEEYRAQVRMRELYAILGVGMSSPVVLQRFMEYFQAWEYKLMPSTPNGHGAPYRVVEFGELETWLPELEARVQQWEDAWHKYCAKLFDQRAEKVVSDREKRKERRGRQTPARTWKVLPAAPKEF